MLTFEKELLSKNYRYIAGVDEVGRGCLAGPMVVCAAVLNPEHLEALVNNDVEAGKISEELYLYTQIRDSKLITEKKRIELSSFLQRNVLSYSIQIIEPKDLDVMGISKATQMGFYNSVKNLKVAVEHVLTDAFAIKAYPEHLQQNVISGDKKSISIAAASILAKVFRDNLMTELAPKYPPYGFEKHKGYGTKQHLQCIKDYGPCEIHRFSFEPIKSLKL